MNELTDREKEIKETVLNTGLSGIDRESKHLHFTKGPSKPKTKTWYVVNKYDDINLGWIGWFAKWRKYAFFPKTETVYEEDCLRDIAQFCVDKTTKHKKDKSNSIDMEQHIKAYQDKS